MTFVDELRVGGRTAAATLEAGFVFSAVSACRATFAPESVSGCPNQLPPSFVPRIVPSAASETEYVEPVFVKVKAFSVVYPRPAPFFEAALVVVDVRRYTQGSRAAVESY